MLTFFERHAGPKNSAPHIARFEEAPLRPVPLETKTPNLFGGRIGHADVESKNLHFSNVGWMHVSVSTVVSTFG